MSADLLRTRSPAAALRAQRWWTAHPDRADVLLASVLLVLSLAAAVLGAQAGRGARTGAVGPGPGEDVGLDALTAALLVVATAALVLRRRYPTAVWGVCLGAAAGVVLHGGEESTVLLVSLISLYSVGVLKSLRTAVPATVATTVVFAVVVTASDGGIFGDRTVTLLGFLAAAAAVGVAVRGQRAAVAAAEARAQQAERTREDEAERRVTDERLRIARELHDVLAHHVSVINVQAGVARHLLEVDPAQARTALELVRGSSRTVLAEMRTVLGLLRTGEDGPDREPAPSLARVADLVDAMANAGLRTTWEMTGEPGSVGELPDLNGYRIVQEALTNALKHGTGTAGLRVEHGDRVLVIEVRNPLPAISGADPRTSLAVGDGGHGLVGMRERVAALGGRLSAGPAPAEVGTFVLRAELPRGAA